MAGQYDFKLDTSTFTESAEAAKKLAETLEDAIAKADKGILFRLRIGINYTQKQKSCTLRQLPAPEFITMILKHSLLQKIYMHFAVLSEKQNREADQNRHKARFIGHLL